MFDARASRLPATKNSISCSQPVDNCIFIIIWRLMEVLPEPVEVNNIMQKGAVLQRALFASNIHFFNLQLGSLSSAPNEE